MKPSQPITFIDSPPELRAFRDELVGAEWLAIDTEFLRERTYYPKFCLLQIASDRHTACIDPLRLDSLELLDSLFDDPAVTKVFHAGRQDLEILYRLRGRLPAPVFDTQLAAPLIGLPDQIGYAGLVAELLGVSLSKGHSRTDWSLRPLSPEQLRYAADDVVYLGPSYQRLRQRLDELGRLHWLDADFAELCDVRTYEPHPEEAWRKIGGSSQLTQRQVTILQALAAWRENEARSSDTPRNWVVKDEVLIDLARQRPASAEQLRLIRGVDERIWKRFGAIVLEIIRDAAARPAVALEERVRSPRETPEREVLLDILSAVVRMGALRHSLNPLVLAGRKDLREFLDAPEQSPLLHGWRRSMIGEDLLAVLRGEDALRVVNGALEVIPHEPPG